jgi:hypothetical protein
MLGINMFDKLFEQLLASFISFLRLTIEHNTFPKDVR